MVRALHLIFTAYGFWLPNDPRGSGSKVVWSDPLLIYGPATKTHSRTSVAKARHDHILRVEAKSQLKYPPVEFTGVQAQSIGIGFRIAMEEAGYECLACAILPSHVHIVLSRHPRDGMQIIGHLKSKATHQLRETKQWLEERTPWGLKGRVVFLDSVPQIRAAISYAERNPLEAGLRRQKWTFVRPYGA